MPRAKKSSISDMDQIVFVVKNIEETAGWFEKVLGIGPFKYYDIPFTENMSKRLTRGKAGPGKIRKAIAYKGNMMINLNQIMEGETVFKKFADSKGEGLMAMCFYVDDLEKELARLDKLGVEVQYSGTTESTGPFAFVGGKGSGGVHIRLLQKTSRTYDERATSLEKEK